MAILYYDPYGNRKHGEIRGEKIDAFFRLYFDEVGFYEVDEGYTIYGKMTPSGVTRKFKPEEKINTVVCAINLYKNDYQIKQKDQDGSYKDIPQKASKFEKLLCDVIDKQKDQFIGEGLAFKGWLDFIPDNLADTSDIDLFDVHANKHWKLEPFPATDTVPKWEMPKKNGSKGSWSSKGVSLDDKLVFLKKELASTLSGDYSETESLFTLVKAFKKENVDSYAEMESTLSLLKAIIS